MQVAYSSGMEGESLRRLRRRKKLQKLLADVGGPTQAEIDTGTPRTHFVALAAGRRGLGDDLAAKLEQAYGKPAGWFDADDAAGARWPFTEELHRKVLTLSDEALYKLERAMRAHLDMPHISASDFANSAQFATVEQGRDAYPPAPEEGLGLPDSMQIPGPKLDVQGSTNRRRTHRKGGGGA